MQRAVAGRQVTKVVHAAVFTGLRQDIERDHSRSIVDINVTGTANLLSLAMELDIERFLYVSSGSVYGEGLDPDAVLHEDQQLHPRTLYAVTKYASELLTRRFGGLHGFPTVSTRLSAPYGPMERVTGHRAIMSVFYEWTRDAVRGDPIRIGDPTAGRDYTYVADTAEAVCSILDAQSLTYSEYNVSSGHVHTLEGIALALKEVRPSVRIVDDPTYEVRSLRPDAARGPWTRRACEGTWDSSRPMTWLQASGSTWIGARHRTSGTNFPRRPASLGHSLRTICSQYGAEQGLPATVAVSPEGEAPPGRTRLPPKDAPMLQSGTARLGAGPPQHG